MYKYLDNIHSPNDLKHYDFCQMEELATEIRNFLIEKVSKTGGHLASNLGVVELTLALYKIFDAPKDKIIFDVGHQCYVSKLITGRKEKFDMLRKENGISGFPKITESEYDAFGTGHSSTALSAAIGIARANKLSGNNNYTVAVVGDGAFSGGLVYEALNNCAKDLNLILILNENEMSISKNVGNISHMISKIRSKENYFKIKNRVQSILEKVPVVGNGTLYCMKKVKKAVKNAIFSSNLVEHFGFTYFGPIDGNDYPTVERLIAQAKKHGGSAFIHIKTKKGKGYIPAEENPADFHMIKPLKTNSRTENFSLCFGEYLCNIAKQNEKVCAISAAMTDGTGLTEFFKLFPQRAFDVGIAEAHAVTFSAGLAISGFIPVFAVYSSFLQRSFDNCIHDVSLQNLHCVFAIDRAGLSPEDGATHHGIFDVSMFSLLNNATVYSPICVDSLKSALESSVQAPNGIYAIRYPKGEENTEGLEKKENYIFANKGYVGNEKKVIVTYGRIFTQALKAAKNLNNCAVLVLEKIIPYSDSYNMIKKYCRYAEKIIIVEEGAESGGFGQNIVACASKDYSCSAKFSVLAIGTEVPGHASLETLYKNCGISADDILKEALK